MYEIKLYNEHGISLTLSNVFNDPIRLQTILENNLDELEEECEVENVLNRYTKIARKKSWSLELRYITGTELYQMIDNIDNKYYLKVVAK